MKSILHTWLVLLCTVALTSCGSYKKFDYAPAETVKSLEGVYVNNNNIIAQGFNLDHKKFRETDFFKFEYPDSQTLNISYLSDSGYQHVMTYEGKYDPKHNCFDIVFVKKVKIYLVANHFSVNKVRLGKNKDNYLVINKVDDGYANLFIVMGGTDYSFVKTAYPATPDVLMPVKVNGKWGFRNALDKRIIEPRYEYVRTFEGDVACVEDNGMCGLIDKTGQELAPLKYKKIDHFNDKETAQVCTVEDKYGFIDRKGVEIVPAIYDHINDFGVIDNLTVSKLGSKYGILSHTQVVFPPIFDKVIIDSYNRDDLVKQLPSYAATVMLTGRWYVVDKDGYIYRTGDHFMKGQRVRFKSKRHYTELVENDEHMNQAH